MTRLNSEFNSEEGQLRLKQVSGVRNIPTPRQLDRVISLARRIPELSDVWDELELVKKDYRRVLKGSAVERASLEMLKRNAAIARRNVLG